MPDDSRTFLDTSADLNLIAFAMVLRAVKKEAMATKIEPMVLNMVVLHKWLIDDNSTIAIATPCTVCNYLIPIQPIRIIILRTARGV